MLYFVSDFETTTFRYEDFDIPLLEGESKEKALINYIKEHNLKTEVWSAASVELGKLSTEDVFIQGSIDKWFDFVDSFTEDVRFYFHNLSFDGSYILDALLHKGYQQVGNKKGSLQVGKTFNLLVTETGRWFSLAFKNKNNASVNIWNSLNLLPFSVKKIGKDFNTKYQKSTMNYYNIKSLSQCTESDIEYIKNDVLILSEVLYEMVINQKLDKITIGSCCMEEYKKLLKQEVSKINSSFSTEKEDAVYRTFFKDLTKISLDWESFGSIDGDDYIRGSYRGGWCYVNPRIKETYKKFINSYGVIEHEGTVYDYNSMHPSMMLKYSFPVGRPTFWKGNYIPAEAEEDGKLYVIRLKTKFKLNGRHFPSIQLKNNPKFWSNEWLTSSVSTKLGRVIDEQVELTLTQVDYELLKENYELTDTEILDGCYFDSVKGLFNAYINKWARIKETSTGARRQVAKLFMNNLYGKFGTNRIAIAKHASLVDDKVSFTSLREERDKRTENVAVASFITAYSRYIAIKAAEANYDTFCYADTDSIHILDTEAKGIEVDANKLCFWKKEAYFIKSKYLRQKTYIEYIVTDKGEGWEIKCAGLAEECKNILNNYYTEEELKEKGYKEYVHNLEAEFKVGMNIQGKLIPKRISGGIILINTEFSIKESKRGA